MVFKKNTTITGKLKSCFVNGGKVIDSESGQPIDLIGMLSEVYGTDEFSITTSSKKDGDIKAGDE